ncbi:hypothetical protein [Maricaulis sp.]|jgi:hypothetical protein|uniref:hypothetical protein n=1 Tax=Maricaulis sp. TaxID=1486257 RepID=UPI002621B04F|nr:hypothetical protein [Maricaulis sp.]
MDHLGPALLLCGLAAYLVLVMLGLFAGWHMPYPVSLLWLPVTGAPALGMAIMFLRARDHRVRFADGEDE